MSADAETSIGAGPPTAGTARGVLEALAAATLWGSSGIFSVYLFRSGVSPGGVALLRPVIALVLLVAGALALRPSSLRLDRSGLVFLLGVGGFTVSLFQLSYQMSIDAIGVPSTVAMVFLAPSLVVASAGPLLGEWPTARRILLALLTAAGVWLSVRGAEQTETAFGATGLVWGFLAAVGYAGYTLIGRYAGARWDVITTVVYSTAGACVILAALVPLVASPLVSPATGRGWLLLTAYALVTIAVAQMLFYDALRHAEASRVSIAAAAEPVVAAILATVLLSQGLDPIGWVGLLLVVAGVVGVSLDRTPPAVTT